MRNTWERLRTQPARIIVAEDNLLLQRVFVAFLTESGYEVQAYNDGLTAWDAIVRRPPDLVLSDIRMPGLSGIELCQRLKTDTIRRLIPVILATGIGEELKLEAIEAGADDFLTKPVSMTDLQVRVRTLLRMKAYTDELESAEAVLRSLAISIEAKDPSTEGHCLRLVSRVQALAAQMSVNGDLLWALERASHLHDLGKIGVPEHILLKSGPLTDDEWRVMRAHPVIGAQICEPLRSFRLVRPIIRGHHEKWDGSGYPDGLAGEAIPLGARMLSVADVYDALTSDRPYRTAMPHDQALAVLQRETARGWWDPTIVSAFTESVAGC